LIPAAGRGSRLGASMPKVLFPVNGRPMIDYLLDLYAPVVDGFVLVVHPSAEGMVRAHCRARSTAVEYDVQTEPTGMLDAILIPSACGGSAPRASGSPGATRLPSSRRPSPRLPHTPRTTPSAPSSSRRWRAE